MAKMRFPQQIINALLAESRDMQILGYGESGNMAILYSPSRRMTYIINKTPTGKWKIEHRRGKIKVGGCCGG